MTPKPPGGENTLKIRPACILYTATVLAPTSVSDRTSIGLTVNRDQHFGMYDFFRGVGFHQFLFIDNNYNV